MYSILIVEDDKYKCESVCAVLNGIFPKSVQIHIATAMATAISEINKSNFDLVIVDMSIPSHPLEQAAGSPIPLTTGGLEVIFELQSLGKDNCAIILTQYDDIQIEGVPVPLGRAADEILDKFGCVVLGCLLYEQESERWKSQLEFIIKSL